MSESLGIGMWGLLIVAAVLLAGVAAILFRFRIRPRRDRGEEEETEDMLATGGRLEVMESTPVDAERRLLLVRCDDIEHLIMVGGPADLVVERDVRRMRAAARPVSKSVVTADAFARPLAPEAEQIDARPPMRAGAPVSPPPISERVDEVVDDRDLPEADAEEAKAEPPARPAAPPRPALSAVPAPAPQPPQARREQDGARPAQEERREQGHAAPADRGDSRRAKPKPSIPEPQIARREAAAPGTKRPPQMQPAPVAANQPEEPLRVHPSPPPAQSGERRLTASREERGGPGKSPALPPAAVPWPEADSVESEIVRALSVEPPQTASSRAASPQAAATGKPTSDAGTTLGDLAERLEEALAREVQSASKTRGRADLSLDTFGFDREPPERAAPDQKTSQQQRDRREPPKVAAPAPEPEARRDLRPQPERQEEAPVINLHTRRRESVDPLEDEMARLLGELTGDSNRR